MPPTDAEEILRNALAQVAALECRLEQLASERDAARTAAAADRRRLEEMLGRVADLQTRLERSEAERADAERRAEDAAHAPAGRALAQAEERARGLAERQERWFARAADLLAYNHNTLPGTRASMRIQAWNTGDSILYT